MPETETSSGPRKPRQRQSRNKNGKQGNKQHGGNRGPRQSSGRVPREHRAGGNGPPCRERKRPHSIHHDTQTDRRQHDHQRLVSRRLRGSVIGVFRRTTRHATILAALRPLGKQIDWLFIPIVELKGEANNVQIHPQ